MKITGFLLISFIILSSNNNNVAYKSALIFFPNSKSDMLKEGFQLEKGIYNERYLKNYGDTAVYFHYPTEESKYHKTVVISMSKVDTTYLFNFIKQNQSTADSNTIVLRDEKGNERTHFVHINKRFAHIIFIHPEYKKYRDKVETTQPPEVIEN